MEKDGHLEELELAELKELAQVDIDSMHTYNQVLDEITDEVVRSRLAEFRDHHMAHIEAVSEAIRARDGKPPKSTMDFKGYVIEAFAAIGAAAGMKSALRALRAAERITNRYYGNMVSTQVSPPLKAILRKHFTDEKIHLEYIESNLRAL